MPAISLPLSFTNSFWSQDYRRGLEVLYAKLEQGITENEEIIAFIRARVVVEYTTAASLANPALTGSKGSGFSADDGASLLMAFRGLQAESIAQGEAHKAAGKELESLVADPFEQWAVGHASRIRDSGASLLDGWLRTYELALGDVAKLKSTYLNKTRRADEAEDDAKFAPNNDLGETYTTSPRLAQFSLSITKGSPTKGPTVSQRIGERLRAQLGTVAEQTPEPPAKSPEALPAPALTEAPSDTESTDTVTPPKLDKGKGKEIDPDRKASADFDFLPPTATTKAESSSTVLLAGLSVPKEDLSIILLKAHDELAVRTVKIPILGAYEECFSGEEFVVWLKANVKGLDGSEDRAESAAIELTERENLLRRIGDFGNNFDNSPEVYYQFRPKAFQLRESPAPTAEPAITSPIAPVAKKIAKRSNTLVSYITKTLGPSTNEPPHIRARAEADAAEKAYRVSVRKLDRQRLQVEEKIDDTLKILQKWETDRLRAVKTVLLQYQGTLANLPGAIQSSVDRSAILISTYQPEADLVALIERYRTGSFRPHPQIFESVTHEGTDVVYGIDLRQWASEGGWNAIRNGASDKPAIPPVVTGLLVGLKEAYTKMSSDQERRKAWIYEVPLPVVHHLHEALNDVPVDAPVPPELVARYDAPVIASALKLWLLELDQPIAMWEGWDEIRKIYPSVGADERPVAEDLKTALGRLPKVNLLVLDAVISHLKELIDTTNVEESKEVYSTKLGLSMGRTIVRPKVETGLSIQDRHPTLFFVDLIKHYDEVLPPTIAKKKRESDRPMPTRKRTAPVDLRLNRRSVGQAADPRKLLEAQLALQNPRSRVTSPTKEKTPMEAIKPEITEEPAPAAAAVAPVETPSVPVPVPVPEPAPTAVELAPAALMEPEVAAVPAAQIQPIAAESPSSTPDATEPPPPSFVEPAVTPPRAASPAPPSRSLSPSRTDRAEDNGNPGLQRATSGEAARLRGPRMAATRGPRVAPAPTGTGLTRPGHLASRSGSGSGTSLLERRRPASPAAATNPSDYAPRKHAGHGQAGLFAKRENLATRTMASGSEDETVGKTDRDLGSP